MKLVAACAVSAGAAGVFVAEKPAKLMDIG
jgi:hypothetical protein